MFPRRAVSEFPNDNPDLHDGLVWAAPEPCAAAAPTLRLRAPRGALPRVLGPAWLSDEGEAAPDSISAPPTQPTPQSPSLLAADTERVSDFAPCAVSEVPGSQADAMAQSGIVAKTPFQAFVAALVRVALERGAVRAAAILPALFESERAFHDVLDPTTLSTLQLRFVLEPGSARPTREFVAAADAWRGLLDGTATDLSGCGSTTLDAWGAMLLGALLNAPRDRVEDLRRELRKRGVAAFGLLAA